MLEARSNTARKVSAQEPGAREARSNTARKVSAQEPCVREGRISFVWPCLNPISSKNMKNNETKFNFAQMTTWTVCCKHAPIQRAR